MVKCYYEVLPSADSAPPPFQKQIDELDLSLYDKLLSDATGGRGDFDSLTAPLDLLPQAQFDAAARDSGAFSYDVVDDMGEGGFALQDAMGVGSDGYVEEDGGAALFCFDGELAPSSSSGSGSKRWSRAERETLFDGVARYMRQLGCALDDAAQLSDAQWQLLQEQYAALHSPAECRAEWMASRLDGSSAPLAAPATATTATPAAAAAAAAAASASSSSHGEAPAGRGKWRPDEDEMLAEGVRLYGDSHWKVVSLFVATRSPAQCLHRWKHSLQPNISRLKWTPEEDRRLVDAVRKHGKHWSSIAVVMGNRTGAQCRERFCNKLDPEIFRGTWSAEQDDVLRRAVRQYGVGHWAQIAKLLTPTRTDYQVRKRYYMLTKTD